jgi:hypothetical protein
MSGQPENDERTPLLVESAANDTGQLDTSLPTDNQDETPSEEQLPTLTVRLYVSHFLSTWNSRVFEFGAVLYLAAIFPGTLLPMSVYAVTRGMSAILFSPGIGRYIDTGNRLQVVRLSIGMLKF